MLKPQELFIGAVIWLKSKNKPYEIDDGYDIYKLDEAGELMDAEPIPITPEILTDWCGWNQDKDKVYKPIHAKGVNKIMIAFWKSHRDIQLRQFGEFITSLPHVKYLHQLQALYQLLTGELMPIKLPKNQ